MNETNISRARPKRARWAAIGFLLILSLSVIAWAVEPSVVDLLIRRFPGFGVAINTLTPIQVQVAFTAIVFFILALFAALIVTLAAPKKSLDVKDKDLIKERQDMQRYRRQAKDRQRKINREMREHVEKNQR